MAGLSDNNGTIVRTRDRRERSVSKRGVGVVLVLTDEVEKGIGGY